MLADLWIWLSPIDMIFQNSLMKKYHFPVRPNGYKMSDIVAASRLPFHPFTYLTPIRLRLVRTSPSKHDIVEISQWPEIFLPNFHQQCYDFSYPCFFFQNNSIFPHSKYNSLTFPWPRKIFLWQFPDLWKPCFDFGGITPWNYWYQHVSR